MTSLNSTALCLNLTLAEAQAHSYTATKLVLITILIPVISVFGLFTNSIFLFIIYRLSDMRTTTNFYLANLAVADILVLLSGCVYQLGKYIASPIADYPYVTPFKSRAGCEAPYLIHYLSLYTSIFFVCLVAYERHMAICSPMEHRKISSRTRTLRLASLAWLLPLIFVSAHIGSFEFMNICLIWPDAKHFIGYPTYLRKCKWYNGANISIYTFAFCQYVIAFIANGVMYINIIRTLSKRQYKKGKTARARNHVARMLGINACVFFTCLVPMEIIYISIVLQKLFGADDDPKVYDDNISRSAFRYLYWASVAATFVNSAVNPIIYSASNPDYRKAFCRAFVNTFDRKERGDIKMRDYSLTSNE